MDAPREGEKKRQKKQQYKFKARHGGVWGTEAAKIGKKNRKLKRENDEMERKDVMLSNDLILI
jgi:hypothetical protein